MIRKDKKTIDLVEKQNEERKEMYASQSEIIKEVVEALTDKTAQTMLWHKHLKNSLSNLEN